MKRLTNMVFLREQVRSDGLQGLDKQVQQYCPLSPAHWLKKRVFGPCTLCERSQSSVHYFSVKLERFKADRNGIADAGHVAPCTGSAQAGRMTWWNAFGVQLLDNMTLTGKFV